jgi:hypothetical protein
MTSHPKSKQISSVLSGGEGSPKYGFSEINTTCLLTNGARHLIVPAIVPSSLYASVTAPNFI